MLIFKTLTQQFMLISVMIKMHVEYHSDYIKEGSQPMSPYTRLPGPSSVTGLSKTSSVICGRVSTPFQHDSGDLPREIFCCVSSGQGVGSMIIRPIRSYNRSAKIVLSPGVSRGYTFGIPQVWGRPYLFLSRSSTPENSWKRLRSIYVFCVCICGESQMIEGMKRTCILRRPPMSTPVRSVGFPQNEQSLTISGDSWTYIKILTFIAFFT